jgi:hypothetical protein
MAIVTVTVCNVSPVLFKCIHRSVKNNVKIQVICIQDCILS